MDKTIIQKPWGDFVQFCHNEQCTVKILNVKANEELSLQYHNNRDEFWKILEGEASIIIGDITKQGKKGDEFFIKRLEKHRIRTSDSDVSILEVSFGEFDENDIVRLEDKYDREKTD
ncbi:MAG: phosphomannose isomerase type II C-terminal cupin domain [Candidatus Woesearchaeota archaeon]